jgi:hypothetical protein
VVSNLATLDGVLITASTVNGLIESDRSAPAIIKLVTLLERDLPNGAWRQFTTPVFEPTNAGRLFWPSQFNANVFLRKD